MKFLKYNYFLEFVNKIAIKSKYKIDAAKYRVVLTNLCATLRHPKSTREKSTNKKTTGKGVKDGSSEEIERKVNVDEIVQMKDKDFEKEKQNFNEQNEKKNKEKNINVCTNENTDNVENLIIEQEIKTNEEINDNVETNDSRTEEKF